jgi:hypothetical protein
MLHQEGRLNKVNPVALWHCRYASVAQRNKPHMCCYDAEARAIYVDRGQEKDRKKKEKRKRHHRKHEGSAPLDEARSEGPPLWERRSRAERARTSPPAAPRGSWGYQVFCTSTLLRRGVIARKGMSGAVYTRLSVLP